MTTNCELYRDLLVDYTDGELSDDEQLPVREHLRACAACRVQLARLQRSLEHAQSIWQEAASPATASAGHSLDRERGTANRHVAERPVFQVALVASAVAIAILVAIFSPRMLRNLRRTAEPDRVAHREPQRSVEPSIVAEIESLIARETQSARLATSADYLADYPSLDLYRQTADDYLATAYVDSQAGQQFRKRRDSFSNESNSNE